MTEINIEDEIRAARANGGHVIVRIGCPMPHYPWSTYEATLPTEELISIVEIYGLERVPEEYETSAVFAKCDDGEFRKIT